MSGNKLMDNFVALVKYQKDEFFYVYNLVIENDRVSIRSANEDEKDEEWTKEYSEFKKDIRDGIVKFITDDPTIAMRFVRLFT